MSTSRSHPNPTDRDRFVWRQDEFDEALELGEQAQSKPTTSNGDETESAGSSTDVHDSASKQQRPQSS